MWNVKFKSYDDSTMYPPINENNFTLTLALGYFFIPTTPLQQFPRDPESKYSDYDFRVIGTIGNKR